MPALVSAQCARDRQSLVLSRRNVRSRSRHQSHRSIAAAGGTSPSRSRKRQRSERVSLACCGTTVSRANHCNARDNICIPKWYVNVRDPSHLHALHDHRHSRVPIAWRVHSSEIPLLSNGANRRTHDSTSARICARACGCAARHVTPCKLLPFLNGWRAVALVCQERITADVSHWGSCAVVSADLACRLGSLLGRLLATEHDDAYHAGNGASFTSRASVQESNSLRRTLF